MGRHKVLRSGRAIAKTVYVTAGYAFNVVIANRAIISRAGITRQINIGGNRFASIFHGIVVAGGNKGIVAIPALAFWRRITISPFRPNHRAGASPVAFNFSRCDAELFPARFFK